MPQQCDLILRAEIILTQDAERTIIRDGALAITAGRVAALGPAEEIGASHPAAEVLDLGPSLVLPGLVNAHTHASMTLFRGLADDMPLMDWLTQNIWPAEKNLTREMVHFGALLACAEMIASGTTCFCDMYLIEEETARAVDSSGMRAVLGEGVFAFPSPGYADPSSVWEVVDAFCESWKDHPRISTAVMPHAVYTTTPEILSRSWETALRHDCPWKIHLAETRQETENCLKNFGHRPLAYLENLGITGERVVLAHGIDLTPEEIERLAASGASVVHNPESNMKLANGVAPVQQMLQSGVNVALGTDGAASNNDLDMLAELTTAALCQKQHLQDPTALKAQAALDMATCNGARAMGLADTGRLEPGASADLIALDLTRPAMMPLYNPVSQVVYAAGRGELRLNMVAGRVLYRDGKHTTLDMEFLAREAKRVRDWVLANRG